MQTKYFNDGIIGNKKLTASFTKNGELIRLFYGSSDYKQFVNTFHVGLKINDSALIFLHNDINNSYSQEYIKDTNILRTEILNTYFNVRVIQTDFIPMGENFLVRNYKIKNENTIPLNINFLAYSKLFSNLNNDTCGYVKNDCLIQYNHDFSICIFAKEKLLSYQVNDSLENFKAGNIGGKDYIGMSPDSAISYDFEVIKPGEEINFSLYVYVNKNKEKCLLNTLDNEIERVRKIDVRDLLESTKRYWRSIVSSYDKLNVNKSRVNEKIKNIYNRSLLLFPLLINEKTGGISAGIEVDENKTKCGRYSYCWPRDAVFITKAMDIVGMKEESEKFYSDFCQKTQSKTGMWEQRFYTDGRLAPSWGYQIDETASVIFGVYEHFLKYKDINFLKDNLKMCENAALFLEKYIDNIFENKNEFKLSYDLWEEFEGISFYSICAVFAGFSSMIEIYKNVKNLFEKNRLKIEAINNHLKVLEKKLIEVKEYTMKTFYSEEKKSYVRNNVDKKIDISLLGSVYPFKMFVSKEKNIMNTVERINMTLRTYTGGYVRYENDTYMGGFNPWPIATLWMACYYLELGENQKALECFNFVTNSASTCGFLGEQVNNEKMSPAWVIGLTWSHAMYIIVLEKLLFLGTL